MSKTLIRTLFGNPVLRQQTRQLSKEEILSTDIQDLINDIKKTLQQKRYGIGLAAPQVGKDIALSVIYIRPTKIRPDLPKSKWAELVIINPEITQKDGDNKDYWEGCISLPDVFAKVPRARKVRVKYLDDKAVQHEKDFVGLLAHVIQHEIDHLNGILFVDNVKDPETFISSLEYKRRIIKNEKGSQYD